MRLTWRDGATTLLGALVVAMGLATTRSWGWPLLGSYRTGIVLLAVVGVVTCAVGGMTVGDEPPSFKGLPLSRLLHLAVPVIVVVGLVSPSRGAVLALVGVIAAQWAVATIRHLLGTLPARPRIA
jgi:hypothetical protein